MVEEAEVVGACGRRQLKPDHSHDGTRYRVVDIAFDQVCGEYWVPVGSLGRLAPPCKEEKQYREPKRGSDLGREEVNIIGLVW